MTAKVSFGSLVSWPGFCHEFCYLCQNCFCIKKKKRFIRLIKALPLCQSLGIDVQPLKNSNSLKLINGFKRSHKVSDHKVKVRQNILGLEIFLFPAYLCSFSSSFFPTVSSLCVQSLQVTTDSLCVHVKEYTMPQTQVAIKLLR